MTNQYLEKIAARLSRKSMIESGKAVIELNHEYSKKKTKTTKAKGRNQGTGRKWARGSVSK